MPALPPELLKLKDAATNQQHLDELIDFINRAAGIWAQRLTHRSLDPFDIIYSLSQVDEWEQSSPIEFMTVNWRLVDGRIFSNSAFRCGQRALKTTKSGHVVSMEWAQYLKEYPAEQGMYADDSPPSFYRDEDGAPFSLHETSPLWEVFEQAAAPLQAQACAQELDAKTSFANCTRAPRL